MSLFKKRAQKRAADAAASESAPLAKLSIEIPAEGSIEVPAEGFFEVPAEGSIEVPTEGFIEESAEGSIEESAAEVTPKSSSKFADEPPPRFSAKLAARLSGEPQPQPQPSLEPSSNTTKSPQTLSWEVWYAKFKTVATLGNPRLQLQGADENIIDLMDHQPLIEAFNSAVDPTRLGEQFAADFDVGAFLRDNGVFK
ncbi:hypothetical protein N9F21_03095 [Porticoccaceae bacterium]|nr:hypothetical protein [Porticoccaceae bacterium]